MENETFEIPAEDLAGIEQEELVEELEAAAPEADLLTREQFADAFAGMFGVASAMSGVKSLAVADAERAGCDKTAEKVYDAFSRSPTLRAWFLANGGAFVADWLLIAGFLGKKTIDVVAEVRGVERKDVLTAAGERIGRGMLKGIVSKLAFWKRGAE